MRKNKEAICHLMEFLTYKRTALHCRRWSFGRLSAIWCPLFKINISWTLRNQVVKYIRCSFLIIGAKNVKCLFFGSPLLHLHLIFFSMVFLILHQFIISPNYINLIVVIKLTKKGWWWTRPRAISFSLFLIILMLSWTHHSYSYYSSFELHFFPLIPLCSEDFKKDNKAIFPPFLPFGVA